MVKKGYIYLIEFLFILLISINLVYAASFTMNGTVYDIDGNRLNNSVINITGINSATFAIQGYNSTTTNASGWFSFTVQGLNDATFYKPLITYVNDTHGHIEKIGQSLPPFHRFAFSNLGEMKYYLKEAGTINITVFNTTRNLQSFNYQIKDKILGYTVASSMGPDKTVIYANIVVPRNRNYSVLVYPNGTLPLSFNWDNFTSTNSYTITDTVAGSTSSFNSTIRTLHKEFNTTLSLPRVSGFINVSGVSSLSGWDEFTVVPYLIEPGGLVHATYGSMPYNLSFFGGGTDTYSLVNGFYNITLPAPAESADFLLFATARNGTSYFGGFTNFSLAYGGNVGEKNITMYGLIGKPSNISMDNSEDFSSKKNITVAKHEFKIVNGSHSVLGNISGHIEIKVDYSNYGAFEFTWMEEIPQSKPESSFQIALLNVSDVKEINIYAGGGNYAPKRLTPTIASLISDDINNLNKTNVTIGTFSPGDIDGEIVNANIRMGLYLSNSTCDVPAPADACFVGGTESNMSNFNPIGAIIGGGKLSFRMGTGNISVHYVNVDMIASGPPDALFDDTNENRSSGSTFDSAVRFGSGGPSIYDFILVSLPYTEDAGGGLNDSANVNMSIPLFYDDNWNIIWNGSANGTNAAALAGNFSHFSSAAGDWSYLMNTTTCTTVVGNFNNTKPCYIDTTGNLVWIRLPHFSGTGPSIVGSLIPVASSSSSSSSSGGGGGASSTSFWKNTFNYDKKELKDSGPVNKKLKVKQRIRVEIESEKHFVGVRNLTETTATIEVSSDPQEAEFTVGEEKKFDVNENGFYDLMIKLIDITGVNANISINYINEKVIEEVPDGVNENDSEGTVTDGSEKSDSISDNEESKSSSLALIIIVFIIIIVTAVIIGFIFWKKKHLK